MSETEKKTANPGPLGLLGFGLATILLNLHNAGIIELSIVILAMGIALGGGAQLVAGIAELRIGNTFGGVAFTAYGLFWWSLCLIWTNPFSFAGASSTSLGFYLLLWGIFTFFMFIATLAHNLLTQMIFLTLAILFILLAIGDFTQNHTITRIAGIEGILCGALAVYSAVGQVINGEFKRKILPV